MTPDARPVRVDAVLADVLDKHGVSAQVARMEALELWADIVGEQVGNVTRARAVEDGTLIVEVRNSAWLMELNMMKGDFLRQVNERMEDAPMERIVFVLAETR